MIATAVAVAFVVFSCKGKKEPPERLDFSKVPVQTINDMFAVQSNNGALAYRMEADRMLRFDEDSCSYETFPDGLKVYGYTEDGLLETFIMSDNAIHMQYKNRNDEYWEATGNVVIQNLIKQETMETDSLFWDQKTNEIYTECYVRMYSADGFMQGYGMRSDDKARHAVIKKPFNSYGVVVQDTTRVVIDSVNFIGPFLKK